MQRIFKITGLCLLISLIFYGCRNYQYFSKSSVFFNPALPLKGGKTGLIQPCILQDKDDVLYATWVVYLSHCETLFLSRSFDNGETWQGKPLDLGNQLLEQSNHGWWPFCFKKDSEGYLYLVQAIHYPGIFFSKSNDKGETWIQNIQVNDDRRKFAYCRNPTFAIDNEGTLFIIYTKKKKVEEINPRKKEENFGVYLSKSFDGGNSWSNSVLLKEINYLGATYFPSLLSYQNLLYLAYGNSIYKSSNKGKDWKRILRVKGEHTKIKIIIKNDSQGNLYIVWPKGVVTKKDVGLGGGKLEGYVDIRFSKSINQGRTWTRSVHINDIKLPFEWKMAPPGINGTEQMKYLSQVTKEPEVFDLAVTEDGQIIGVIWKDWRSGEEELYFSYSLDGGKSWSRNTRINFTQGVKAASMVISKDGSIYILWTKHNTYNAEQLKSPTDSMKVYFSSGSIGKDLHTGM